MSYTIYEDIDLFNEYYYFLYYLINEGKPYHSSEKISEKFNIPKMDLEELFGEINQLYEEIENSIDDMEYIELLFKNIDDLSNCLASTLRDNYLEKNFQDEYEYLTSCKCDNKFNYIKGIILSNIIADKVVNNKDLMDIRNEQELISFIHNYGQISYDTKIKIVYVYYNFEVMLKDLLEILKKISDLIEDKLKNIMPELKDVRDTISERLSQEGNNFFYEFNNLVLNKNEHLNIRFSISSFNKVIFRVRNNDEYDVLFGIYALKIQELKTRYNKTDADILEFLKVISDDSKFKIIKVLNQEQLYSLQLAEKLGVSNPTISHHMSNLITVGLVRFEKKKNRIYYSLNKEKLKMYLNVLYKLLD